MLFLFYVAGIISSTEAFGDCVGAGSLVVRAYAGKKLSDNSSRECLVFSINTALGYSPVSFPLSQRFFNRDSPLSNKRKKLYSAELDQEQSRVNKEDEANHEQLSPQLEDSNNKQRKQEVNFQWARRLPRPRLPPMPWGNRKGDPVTQPTVVQFAAGTDPMDIHEYFMALAVEQGKADSYVIQ
jgi:hypothetical protein